MRDLTRDEQLNLYDAIYGGVPADADELDSFMGFVALTAQPASDYPRSAEKVHTGFQVSKGLARGTLFIRDFGDFRAVYFDGEGL